LCRVRQTQNTAQWGVPTNRQIANTLAAFGANLRRARLAQGLTQERLAELVELNVRTIQKIEAGHTNILLTTVLRLQAAVQTPWRDLMPS
jgi:transcriptional regulator with XRE-family HTH domain